MSPPRETGSQELAETLTRGLQATASLIQSLSGEIRDNSVALAAFSADLKHLRENVSGLSRILKDGDGEDSLITKTRLIEKWIEDAEDDMATLKAQITALEKSHHEQALQDKQGANTYRGTRLAFWGTLITAIIGAVGSALALLLK